MYTIYIQNIKFLYACVYIYKFFEIYRQLMYKLHIKKVYIPYRYTGLKINIDLEES